MKCRLADVDLEYDVSGASRSPTLLFVHGFPHDRKLWAPQMHALSNTFQCVAVDLRGFGESSSAPPYSVDRYADDLAELLDAIGVERAVIGGLSLGGYIAFALWRRHPHRVQGFILADTRSSADSDEGRAKRRDTIALVRDGGVSALPAQSTASQLGETTRARQPELASTVFAMSRRASTAGVIGALEAMMARPDSSTTLPTITVPTLIVVGDEDIFAPPAEARAMHALIAGSRLEVIRGAGHLSNLERPAAFNAIVSAWASTACDTAEAL